MYALEQSELPPRIMPHVLATWGLKPRTDPSETADLGDRGTAPTAIVDQAPVIPGGCVVDIKQEWWDGSGSIFFIWGILNPNGPTLYVLGSREFNGKQRLFYRWLHMLGGHTTYAAESAEIITDQWIYEEAKSIHRHLVLKDDSSLFNVIPYFFIVNAGDDTLINIAKKLLREISAPADWGAALSSVRTFGSNFFRRAGSEIRSYYDSEKEKLDNEEKPMPEYLRFIEARYGHIPDFREAVFPPVCPSPMTPELLEEWWKIVDTREFRIQALMSLMQMWDGAITVIPEMRGTAIPFERTLEFLSQFGFNHLHSDETSE